MNRRHLIVLALPVLLTALVAAAPAEDPPKQRDVTHYNLGKDGLALEGYDPVAYFEEGGAKPREGSKEVELRHRGVLYRFATAENRARFEKDPARYEPAYGGWCAYAMAKGEKVEVDPKSFLVTDGELTLFYKGLFNDTRKKWLKDPDKLERKADEAWKKILARKE